VEVTFRSGSILMWNTFTIESIVMCKIKKVLPYLFFLIEYTISLSNASNYIKHGLLNLFHVDFKI